MSSAASILFLDNFDSFSYSLVDEFRRAGASVEVWRNDTPLACLVERLGRHDLLAVSPGPGRPEDAGALLPLLREAAGRLPVFGVCLGMQAMAVAFGGAIARTRQLVHGKAGAVHHDERGLFRGLPDPLWAGRYHSLVVSEVPPEFCVTAWSDEAGTRVPMAMEDSQRRLLGVQFHPESLLTREGSRLVARVLEWARP
ncbi:MAG: anthranilate synthase component II [Gammaproteobacteria bacterium]